MTTTTTERPECYERAPDGQQWPGTLKGLLAALDETEMEAALTPGTVFTLQAIRHGHAVPFRTFHGNHHEEDE